VVSIIGCTGDWFGGWDGLSPGSPERFITEDLRNGRLPEVIARGEPAILVCHWPGIYFNGEKIGFQIFQEVVRRLHARYENLLWMKLSEIARYWAARELTQIGREDRAVHLRAPFACPRFTLEIEATAVNAVRLVDRRESRPLQEVKRLGNLIGDSWHRQGSSIRACFDLPRGESRLQLD
jgi:hypothetical protein